MNNNKRIECIDIAKGIAIFIVCWIHIASNVGAFIPATIAPFFMGTFMLLSAYFYKPGKGYFQNVKKRFKQIVVPLILYSAIALIVYYLFLLARGTAPEFIELPKAYGGTLIDFYAFKPIVDTGNPAGQIQNVLYPVVGPYWFLLRIFISELIFFAVADWALKSIKRLIPVIIVLLSITCALNLLLPVHLIFQLENCFAIAGLMLAGAYAKQRNVVDYIENNYKSVKYWIVAAIVLAAYLALFPLKAFGVKLVDGEFGPILGWSVFPWFATVLVGTYLLLILCTFIN